MRTNATISAQACQSLRRQLPPTRLRDSTPVVQLSIGALFAHDEHGFEYSDSDSVPDNGSLSLISDTGLRSGLGQQVSGNALTLPPPIIWLR